jgi:hypothetical protein
MPRIGINILTNNETYVVGHKKKHYSCTYCDGDGYCRLDKHSYSNLCPYDLAGDEQKITKCTLSGHDFDEVCKMLAMQEPSGVKEILLQLAGKKNKYV